MEQLNQQLLQYVAENKQWSEAVESEALSIMDNDRCPLKMASPRIYYEISTLVEDFISDNDLPQDWSDSIDIEEDIFWELDN